jgi:hypothetical protein
VSLPPQLRAQIIRHIVGCHKYPICEAWSSGFTKTSVSHKALWERPLCAVLLWVTQRAEPAAKVRDGGREFCTSHLQPKYDRLQGPVCVCHPCDWSSRDAVWGECQESSRPGCAQQKGLQAAGAPWLCSPEAVWVCELRLSPGDGSRGVGKGD